MWIKLFPFVLILFCTKAFSQSEILEPFGFEVYFDALTKESRLNRPESSDLSHIRELSLGLSYQVQEELGIFMEASAEELEGNSDFFISQVYLDLDFREHYFSSLIGQLYYPVGWLNEEDNYFLNQPFYYESLFVGQKGIDVGVVARAHPFKNDSFIIEGSCFEGRVFRATDQRSGRAERRPCSIGLRGQTDAFEVYYTHFEHDLAFYDKVSADGVGIKWISPLQKELFKVGVWGEYWRINSPQENGPTSLTQGGFIYPYADLWRFRLGYRLAPVVTEVSYTSMGSVKSEIEDRLFRVEYKILEPLRLIYEDQQAKQKDAVALKDEWAVRLLFIL